MYIVYNSNAGEYENCDTLEQVRVHIEDQCENDSAYSSEDFVVYKESHSVKLERTFKVELVTIK